MNYEVIPVRRLLSNIVSDYEVLSHDELISPQDFLRDIEKPVMRFIDGRRGNKVHLVLVCEMERADLSTGAIEETEEAYFRTLQVPVYGATDLEGMYETMKTKMLESFSNYLRNGNGWRPRRVLRLTIRLSRNRALRGSSYLPHPKGLKTQSLINIKNKKDNLCFPWSILRHKYPKKKDPQFIGDLKEHFNEFNWDGIEFPTPCCEKTFKRFEKNNNVSLAVYGHEVYTEIEKGEEVEKVRIIPLYVPAERREEVYHIFFYKDEDGTKWHYNTVKSLRGLVSGQVRSHNKGKGMFICDYCLNYFGTQYKAVRTILPEPGKNIMKFKNIQNCIECPVKFIFDTESILKRINEMKGKTKLYQRHVMSGFCILPILRVEGASIDHVTYIAETRAMM